MPINEKLPEALKRHYKLVYREDHLRRREFLCLKKRPREIHAMKCIIEGCRDWRFLGRMYRSDILQHFSGGAFLKNHVSFRCKLSGGECALRRARKT